MASGPAANPPPPSPSTLPLPLLVQPPPEDDHEIIDLDRPLSRSSNGGSSHWNDLDDLYPSRDRAFLSPDEATSPRRPSSRMSESSIPDVAVSAASPNTTPSPFNFQTQFISTSPVKSTIGQRRGHKYKHSSVSSQHQIIKEPPRRAPPVLPASLPVPTLREAWASMRKDQRARLYWCICHGLIAAYVFFSAGESLALTALSHLVFFDVGSAAICMGVDVLGNFEVWKRSSIRHPFGLQRAEVLAGFALSIFLVFGGFDLLSHNLKHILESVGSHAPHYPHEHSHSHGPDHVISAGEIDTASLAAALSTLVSAYGLKNHARIRRVMQPSYLSTFLPEILANPFHSLTLFFSFLMLLLPLLSVTSFVWLDRLVCVAIAVSMFILGSRLAIAQGLMLLMSYNGRAHENETTTAATTLSSSSSSSTNPIEKNTATDSVVREIESEPAVSRVEEAQFWQVHYGLCMATVKLCVIRGCDDAALSQLRQRIGRIVQNRLGGEGYGKGGPLKWEITLQMTTDSA